MRSFARQLLVIVLSAALASGFTVRFVQTGSIDATAATAMALDMPMHGKCDGCAGNDKATAATACSPYCSGLTALPAMTAAAVQPLTDDIVTPAVEPTARGHIAAPDPYPPRPIVLS